jgi:hypothetical protein
MDRVIRGLPIFALAEHTVGGPRPEDRYTSCTRKTDHSYRLDTLYDIVAHHRIWDSEGYLRSSVTYDCL